MKGADRVYSVLLFGGLILLHILLTKSVQENKEIIDQLITNQEKQTRLTTGLNANQLLIIEAITGEETK